jgi:hypothetical protein
MTSDHALYPNLIEAVMQAVARCDGVTILNDESTPDEVVLEVIFTNGWQSTITMKLEQG